MKMSSYSEEDVCKLPEPDFTWDVTSELALYQALLIHKPAGINKHFAVALVADRLTDQLGKSVLASAIWKKLKSMFDLRAVEDREESIPFSLEAREFCLPRREFESLLLDRRREWRRGEKSRPSYFFSQTPSTPKSEAGSESRSSPLHRDLLSSSYWSEEDDQSQSDFETDSDENESFDHLEVESTKSDSTRLMDEQDEAKDISDKDALIAQARDEIEKKLQHRGGDRPKSAVKAAISKTTEPKSAEPKTPRDEEKVWMKRHITRSTPGSTPNKRRK